MALYLTCCESDTAQVETAVLLKSFLKNMHRAPEKSQLVTSYILDFMFLSIQSDIKIYFCTSHFSLPSCLSSHILTFFI